MAFIILLLGNDPYTRYIRETCGRSTEDMGPIYLHSMSRIYPYACRICTVYVGSKYNSRMKYVNVLYLSSIYLVLHECVSYISCKCNLYATYISCICTVHLLYVSRIFPVYVTHTSHLYPLNLTKYPVYT